MSDKNVFADLAPIDASSIGNRIILKELHGNSISKHSPLNAKSSSVDIASPAAASKSNATLSPVTACPRFTMSESIVQQHNHHHHQQQQQQQQNITNASIPGTSSSNITLNNNGFEKVPELQADGYKRFSNRFIGLTEYDEADIPDLPNNMSSNMNDEDPLKLTFDEGVLESLCPNSANNFDYSSDKRGNSTSDLCHLQIPNNDPDTALSSDNEIYAECLSYRDSELNYELPLEMSDAEHYRSALNSCNNTANETVSLNTTLENDKEKQTLHPHDLTPTSSESVQNNANIQYSDCEPMDVDMTLELSHNSNNSTLEVNHIFGKQKIEQEPSSENITQSISEANDATKSVENSQVVDAVLKDDDEKACKNADEQKEPTPLHNKEENENEKVKKSNEELENLSKNLSNLKEFSPQRDDTKPQSNSPQHQTVEPKLSVIVDNIISANHTQNTQQSSETSPNFPVKSNVQGSSSKFPTSPTEIAKEVGPSTFLERSPYSEYSRKHSDNSNDQVAIKITCPSPRKSENKKSNIDSNIEKSSPVNNADAVSPTLKAEDDINDAQSSPGTMSAITVSDTMSPLSIINSTFESNGSPTVSPNQVEVIKETPDKRRTFNTNNFNGEVKEERRSFDFNVQISPNPDVENSKELNQNDDKRHTFNVNDINRDISKENKRLTYCKAQLSPNADDAPQHSGELNKSGGDDDKRRTFNVNNLTYNNDEENKRLTYTRKDQISPNPDVQHSGELNKSGGDDDKRRTFNANLTFQKPPLQQLNCSSEAMDIDESYSVDLPKSASHSPKSPSPQSPHSPSQITPSFAPSLSGTCTSPLSMMINRPTICSAATAAAAQILSKSPPLPALRSTASNHQEDTFKLPKPLPQPPAAISTGQNKKRISNSGDAPHNLTEILSAKEQTKSNSKDEKDVFVEKFTPSPVEDIFASTSSSNVVNPFGSSNMFGAEQFKTGFTDADFTGNSNIILQPSDFDFLLTKGSPNSAPIDRSSLLLRFDPLLGLPVPVNPTQQQQQALQQFLQKAGTGNRAPTPITEEDQVQVEGNSKPKGSETILVKKQQQQQLKTDTQTETTKKHANMSVDVIKDINIDNDCTKTKELSNIQSDEKQANFKMDELEKKIKNEVLKTEDIEKKLKDAEQREEASIKRITEKDKTISKLNGVIEAYEKAIAELIAEKEQLVHNYEKQLTEIKADRDSNYHHLMSLESTFSDLHAKYEKSKDMTLQLKNNEEALIAEKRQNLENLRMQEQRYEKMKNHAMQQLEIANKTLESMKKEHAVETTKLKALLKKEEISRASTNEQLQQKMRENEELVKICDELINGQGS